MNSLLSSFQCFIGIDQTGAISKNGINAKPLPVSLLFVNKNQKWEIIVSNELFLDYFSPECIKKLFQKYCNHIHLNKTFIAIDSVFGVPHRKDLKNTKSIRSYYKQAINHSHNNLFSINFGRNVAEDFFKLSKWYENSNLPKRLVESIAKANSLFSARPYQKNVQTGSYRTWVELGQYWKDDDYFLWPFDIITDVDKAIIAEIYPSYFWKNYFDSSTRGKLNLSKIIDIMDENIIYSSQIDQLNEDHQDAVIASLGAYKSIDNNSYCYPYEYVEDSIRNREGWILGVKM